MFKKILVPIDGSEHAKGALLTACKMVKECGGVIFLLHVVENLPGKLFSHEKSQHEESRPVEEIHEELEKSSEKLFVDALAAVSDCPVAKRRVEVGDPSSIICQVADEEGCDLIVMGNRELGDIKDVLLGSVSHRVLQKSKVPVLLVK